MIKYDLFFSKNIILENQKNNKKYHNVFSAHSFKMIFLYNIVRMEKKDTK
jgi:hypothetical protein